MRSPRDVAASSNHEAARRLVRSLVGVVDVAFRYGRDGRVEAVAVLPATGAHERQVRLNVASGLMAGFGIALDPAKVELVRTSDELRAIEGDTDGHGQGQVYGHGQGHGHGASAPAPAHFGNGAHAGNGNGASARVNGEAAPAVPPRPVLKPRVPEGAVGLAARAFHAMDEQNMRPPAPPAPAAGPPAAARPPVSPAPPAQPLAADPWDEDRTAVPAEPAATRRVRLMEDADAPRDPAVRPFPAAPAAAAPAEPAAQPPLSPPARGAAYVAPARGGTAAALALPLEPAPAAPPATPAGMPKLEVAEVVAARGATFCRVVVEVGGERFTGVAEVDGHEPPGDAGTLDLVARITADALRSARVPRDPTQFHGATTVLVAGKPFVVAVLRRWNGRSFDDLCAVEPITASPEEAAALAVLKAAASRLA
jgi:hypothetical protein